MNICLRVHLRLLFLLLIGLMHHPLVHSKMLVQLKDALTHRHID